MSKFPKDWDVKELGEVASIQTGLAKGKKNIKDPITLPYLRVANVQDGYLDLTEIKTIQVAKSEVERYQLKPNDVLLTEGGDLDKLGRGYVWNGQIEPCLHQNHIFVVRTNYQKLKPHFFAALTSSLYGRRYFLNCAKRTTNLASINSSQLKAFPVLLPPISEQDELISILNAWDARIEKTERLINAQVKCKRGLMQQLLTGKRRFQEFVKDEGSHLTKFGRVPNDWSYLRIGDIAREFSEKNTSGKALTVLSCTKHRGLVDSLAYFGKRVFSEDTSTYKIVRRGHFAYATNHIEEGSIGYQNLYDEALISPMYTVFEANEQVDASFFYKLLKTELYRHIFEVNTSASVDRRGSLRWKEFANIKVALPSLEEQRRIAVVLKVCDKEFELLKKQLDALKRQKRGLMQKLLTGQIRVKVGDETKEELVSA